ncbi:MAG: hypothetical protein ACKVP5_05760 [Aestuariivirga sp.]
MAKTAKRAAKAARKVAKKPAKAAKPLKDQTPNLGDDVEAVSVRRAPAAVKKAGAARAAMGTRAKPMAGPIAWRVAASLEKLRKQINARAPNRSKLSDGGIGDTNHKNRKSDHNPWVIDGGRGVVTARDITHDAARGCNCHKLAESLRGSRDKRIKYIIWNRRICSSSPQKGMPAWAWRNYVGKNGHTHHMHISVQPLKSLYDSENPWSFLLT